VLITCLISCMYCLYLIHMYIYIITMLAVWDMFTNLKCLQLVNNFFCYLLPSPSFFHFYIFFFMFITFPPCFIKICIAALQVNRELPSLHIITWKQFPCKWNGSNIIPNWQGYTSFRTKGLGGGGGGGFKNFLCTVLVFHQSSCHRNDIWYQNR
jgi:hypothetical protein